MGSKIDLTGFQTLIQEQRRGYMALSLSNWSSSGIPQIIGNVEVAGFIIIFNNLENIDGWSSVSAGIVYIKIIVSNGVAIAQWTSVAPSWSAEKQGWYSPTSGEENQRYVFQATKVDASNVTGKHAIPYQDYDNDSIYSENTTLIDGLDLTKGSPGVAGSITNTIWTPPKGVYMLIGYGLIKIDGVGPTDFISGGGLSGLMIADGLRVTIQVASGKYLYYRKVL